MTNVADADQEQSFLSHLVELRIRLVRAGIGVLLVFLLLAPFANSIYHTLAEPLLAQLPAGHEMVAIDPVAPFLTPVKLSLVLALFIAIPWTLYQAWAFVAPGLYQHEKRLVMPLIVSSTALFYCGMAFAYFVILPIFFAFITGTAPEGVAVMTDISKYLDFVLTLFFAFGVAFEIPVAAFILVMTGITTPEALTSKRPYVILGAFVFGMLLTPPDIISQTLLAIPMWLLFEIGVLLCRVILKRSDDAKGSSTTALKSYDDTDI